MTVTLTETQPADFPEESILPVLAERELRVIDRCDSCNAQAYGRAWKEGYTHELLFCGHHINKHEDELRKSGFLVDNQSKKLYERDTKPYSGSNMAD